MQLRMDTVLPAKERAHKFTEHKPQSLEMRFKQDSWPPTPEGWTHVGRIHARPLHNSINSDVEMRIREVALRDDRVREALGNRFAFINSDALSVRKWCQDSGTEALSSRLMFFSHARNTAVEVTLKGGTVQEVHDKRGYQPKEGQDEIVEAIRLARNDESLRGHVELLDAHAILLPAGDEEIGCGHRTLWITFTESGDANHEKPALFAATVDMITQTVSMTAAVSAPNTTAGGTTHAE
jgi:hypothetical protein